MILFFADYSTQQLADRGSDFLVNEALDLTEKHHRDASPPLVGPDMAFSNAGSISAKNGCFTHSSHLLFGVLLALFYVLKVDCLCMSLHWRPRSITKRSFWWSLLLVSKCGYSALSKCRRLRLHLKRQSAQVLGISRLNWHANFMLWLS